MNSSKLHTFPDNGNGKVKVLYVATAYDRHPSDVITPWLVETIHGLQRAGIEVEVLAPSYRGLPSGKIDGVQVHRFRYAPRRWEDLTHDQTAPDRVRDKPGYLALLPGYAISGMAAAARLARTGEFDLVHVHWPIPHALFGLAARWAAGIPLVCTFHGVELTWTRRQLPILKPFLRYATRSADAVTANSSYTASMVQQVYQREVDRIPFGATTHLPDDLVISRRAEDSPFEILFAGRLVERKGVHYLLDALSQIDPARRITLRVVGDGPMRAELEARAATLGLGERVRFEGFIPGDELARHFAECDLFVLPAIFDSKGDTEGLGVVLVEALSNARPVIASEAGGIVDLIKDHETGYLVPPADARALATAIERVMDNPAEAMALGEAGREYVEREFSWPVIIDRLAALYHRVIDQNER